MLRKSSIFVHLKSINSFYEYGLNDFVTSNRMLYLLKENQYLNYARMLKLSKHVYWTSMGRNY